MSEDEKVVVKQKAVGVSRDAAIAVLVEANIKREGSAAYDRFEGYLTDPQPTTVAEALDNGLTMGDIHYDFIHGSIEVEGATIEEYTPKKREASEDAEVEVEAEDGEDF